MRTRASSCRLTTGLFPEDVSGYFRGKGALTRRRVLWDWSLVPDRGPRFENLLALRILKLCHFLEDRDGYKAEMCYLRDRTGREVDFLVLLDRKPWFCVEAKVSETAIDPALVYFRERLRIPWSYQVVLDGKRDFVERGVRCLPAGQFLAALV